MKKILLVVLIILFTMAFVSCSKHKRDTKANIISLEEAIELKKVGDTLDAEWQYDLSGSFSYLSNIGGETSPYFNEEYEFPDNKFIYKTYVDDAYKYGYMKETFTKLTEPISNEPNIFCYQKARISKDSESFIVNDSFVEIEEYYPGFLLLGKNLLKVDWTNKVVENPFYISDIDYDKFLVPVDVNATITINEEKSKPLYGYKTINDAYFNNIRQSENFVIAPEFNSAGLFYDGLAAVEIEGKWGYIDKSGKMVIDPEYDEAGNFQHGVAPVYDADYFKPGDLLKYDYTYEDDLGRWALINKRGSSMTRFMYRSISPFTNGLAFAVVASDPRIDIDMYTIIRPDGDRIHEDRFLYGKPSPFSDGLTSAQDYFIYENGEILNSKEFNYVKSFNNGMAAVQLRNMTHWGYIDLTGEITILAQYVYAGAFDDGYAFVKDHYTKEGYLIDKLGNTYLKELNLHGISKFNENGYALAYKMESKDIEVENKSTGMVEKQIVDVYTYFMIHIEY